MTQSLLHNAAIRVCRKYVLFTIGTSVLFAITEIILCIILSRSLRYITLSLVPELIVKSVFADGILNIWSTCSSCYFNTQLSEECLASSLEIAISVVFWGVMKYAQNQRENSESQSQDLESQHEVKDEKEESLADIE